MEKTKLIIEAPKIEYTGLSLVDGMFLLFLAFKLAGIIDWSWWFVTAPQWVPPITKYLFAVIIKWTSRTPKS